MCLVGQAPGSTSAGGVSAAAPPICGSGNPCQSLVGGRKNREKQWEVLTARPGTMHITSAPCPELGQMTTPHCKGAWRLRSSHMLKRKKKKSFSGQLAGICHRHLLPNSICPQQRLESCSWGQSSLDGERFLRHGLSIRLGNSRASH